ncbi:S-adenosyl-L-methionine-dependent methyltransferase [Immersiella caudata]|uniref:S-adenosyl-L-methionine-dependent methyltransferase n=1 Tax=Immersiella caudata TaxID=314043 RepID=A0AA39WKC3_9PEZI|nr:S-adenosyl-L-methionine-dependent methyltransferase [Immersiella caudata]
MIHLPSLEALSDAPLARKPGDTQFSTLEVDASWALDMSAKDTIKFDPSVVGNLDDDADVAGSTTSSLRESTASITSSIYEYRTLHGRSYQASNTTEYWFPTDDRHVSGNDVAHAYLTMLMKNKLHLAPVENPKKILDVGTGSGIWAIDIADQYPDAEVIGTDISSVQPKWIPANCSFQIDDAQLDWTFRKDFDFIYIRNLIGGIGDWAKLYRQTFAHLKPGGWIESVEIDIETLSENPRVQNDQNHVFKRWCQLFWVAGDKAGRTFRIARDGTMQKLIEEAGFTDLHHLRWKVPIGGWAQDPLLKQVGLYNGLYIDQSLDGFALFPLAQILGWTFEEVETLVADMRKAIADPKSLPLFTWNVVYARKPE